MFRTLYPAVQYETPFSLMATLALTTWEYDVRHVFTRALHGGPQLLQTSPCRLSRFCALTSDFYGTVKEVLMERTLFPLYRGCMPESLANQIEIQMSIGRRGRTSGPNLPVQIYSVNRFGLECPECSIHTKTRSGRRCSLSFHCTPLQTRCPIHGCLYLLADECSAYETKIRHIGNRGSQRNSLRLSETLHKFLEQSATRYWLDWVDQKLRERRYMSESGRIKLTKLTRDFAAVYSDGFEDVRLTFWLTSGNMISHILHCMRRPSQAPHPVEVALLNNALTEIEYSTSIARTNKCDFTSETE